MKIKQIISQSRRDFRAEFECEHCGHIAIHSGYDDDHFHRNVIPLWCCEKCAQPADEDYQPVGTKYAASEVI